ncbi:hypothetical protein DD563_08075 [Pelagicola sp. LXJ1103]|nr:hypothetical protein DD563_08075 [Pelagicola sp. LXJ1103]
MRFCLTLGIADLDRFCVNPLGPVSRKISCATAALSAAPACLCAEPSMMLKLSKMLRVRQRQRRDQIDQGQITAEIVFEPSVGKACGDESA